MNTRADRRRQARGSTEPERRAQERREAFEAMEQEQWDEYQEYIRMCGGTPISKIEASRPVQSND